MKRSEKQGANGSFDLRPQLHHPTLRRLQRGKDKGFLSDSSECLIIENHLFVWVHLIQLEMNNEARLGETVQPQLRKSTRF